MSMWPTFRFAPLTRRRWHNFKANRRGYWSLWIIGSLVFVSLFAELIANDAPLVMSYQGELYFPVMVTYPESTFGSSFGTEAEYTEPAVQQMIKAGDGWMIWPLVPYSYDTIDLHAEGEVPMPPSARHWLGTDNIGRDVVARLIYGFRLSIIFGLLLTILSSIVGVTVGAVQGYFGGLVDLIGQRLVEIWTGLPVLFLLIIVSSLLQPGPGVLLLLLFAFSWTALIPVVRAEFLRTRNFDHVRAARALGQGDGTIIVRHVLPNAMVATLTFLPFVLNGSIIMLTTLDFLGFGLPLGSPSLGELLAQGKANIESPWIVLSAFCTLAVMLTLLIFVGEGVRDAFDPRRAS
jgi:microcin C transport system permease protein